MDICANCNVYVPDESGQYLCMCRSYEHYLRVTESTCPSTLAPNVILCDQCVIVLREFCTITYDQAQPLIKSGIGLATIGRYAGHYFTIDQLLRIVPLAGLRLSNILYDRIKYEVSKGVLV